VISWTEFHRRERALKGGVIRKPDITLINGHCPVVFMAHNFCKSCGTELIPGKEFCPKCLIRIPVAISKKQYPKDTPENRAKMMKEYKVIGQEDTWLNGGRFDKTSLENMLNFYALEGWTVREISASKTFGVFFGTPRDEMIIILERNLPLEP